MRQHLRDQFGDFSKKKLKSGEEKMRNSYFNDLLIMWSGLK